MIKSEEETWYESGARESLTINKFKDTMRVYNYADSSLIIKGLIKKYYIHWNENGKIHSKEYDTKGKMINEKYNDKGECVQKTNSKDIRPDGYDTLVDKIYYSRGFKHK